MSVLSVILPTLGQPDSSEDAKLNNALTAIQTWANGNIDAGNLTAAFAQSLSANTAGTTAKGAVNIPTAQTITNTSYTLMPTLDQVPGIVLPANGLIRVWYQATWQESSAGSARAAIFVGANQQRVVLPSATGPLTVAAMTSAAVANINLPLSSATNGLISTNNNGMAYTGDVTTGQSIGISPFVNASSGFAQELGGSPYQGGTIALGGPGGSCDMFAAAGTYTVAIMFKALAGSVTASNRKLWVQALSFS